MYFSKSQFSPRATLTAPGAMTLLRVSIHLTDTQILTHSHTHTGTGPLSSTLIEDGFIEGSSVELSSALFIGAFLKCSRQLELDGAGNNFLYRSLLNSFSLSLALPLRPHHRKV